MVHEADELTEEEAAELHAALLTLKEELDCLLSGAGDRTATVDLDQPIGRISRIDALQEQKMALEQKRRVELRQAQVQQALLRVAEGDYGDCRRCEEPVGYGRLKAQPETAFCLVCRQEIERGR